MPVVTRYSDGHPLVAYCLLDHEGTPLAERNATTVFYAASVIKLAVALAALRLVDAARLSLDDALTCPSHFTSGVDAPDFAVAPEDADPHYAGRGERVPLAHLLEAMVCRSSNEATNVVVERIGLDAVADALTVCGASDSRMQRRFGDVAAADAGLTNEVSARDAATIMRCIAVGAFTTPNSTRYLRELLARQEHVRIGTVVPPGTVWGSKSGDVPGIEHDVAFIGDSDAGDARYLAVCTRGYEPEQGRELIASTASALLSIRTDHQTGLSR